MAKKTIEKLKVYLESTISGFATGRTSSNLEVARKQSLTSKWVEQWMKKCDCYVSKYVFDENGKGDQDAANRRCRFNQQAKIIDADEALVISLAKKFLSLKSIPQNQLTDALHVATAAVYGMDVLLTWNCTHINNPSTLPVVYGEIAKSGYAVPRILTPEQFMEVYDNVR